MPDHGFRRAGRRHAARRGKAICARLLQPTAGGKGRAATGPVGSILSILARLLAAGKPLCLVRAAVRLPCVTAAPLRGCRAGPLWCQASLAARLRARHAAPPCARADALGRQTFRLTGPFLEAAPFARAATLRRSGAVACRVGPGTPGVTLS